jgi:hypothetical protein
MSSGVRIEVGGETQRLVASKDAWQEKPRRSYVYAHVTPDGKMFYIGKGTAQRAWSDARHLLWHRYVEKHLGGQYQTVILKDDLSSDEAEQLEAEWIAQESDTLVNWVNFHRGTDFERVAVLHGLRNTNRALIAQAKSLEDTDMEAAVQMYINAIAASADYAEWDTDSGLIGRLLREIREENGLHGELKAIDRLTMCLIKLGRAEAAAEHLRNYLLKFRGDERSAGCEPIRKRVAKALAKERA